jgi:nucleoside-diphosphate-sugar epimerase
MDPIAMPSHPRTHCKDLRRITAADLEGFDGIVHLAELSNDPLGQNNPEITFQINHEGSVRLARLAHEVGVRRFVYASSCSAYGLGTGDFLHETSATNPQTAYAKCKVLVERDLLPMADRGLEVVFLRNATAYGPSPRMRFDIVLNDLCALAWTKKKIIMVSDGSPWRPIVHIEDICEAMCCSLEAPAAAINGEIFNVGRTEENYRVREIAGIVAAAFSGCEVIAGPPSADNRSYRVSFDKIATRLPGFQARWTARAGAEELQRLFQRIEFSQQTYEFRAFTRLKQLKYLQKTAQIDDALFWRAQG